MLRATFILVALALAGCVAVLATPAVRITDVQVAPDGVLTADEARPRILAAAYFERLALLDTGAAAAALLADFPRLASVSLSRQWPHGVLVSVAERDPAGIWCSGEVCRFWDASGARWGTPLPSVGPLLVQVRDERTATGDEARLASGIAAFTEGLRPLDLKAKLVVLPDDEPGGARVELMQGYEVRVDLLGDVPDQLRTLGALLADKAGKPFTPQYVDLRVPGRIYYK